MAATSTKRRGEGWGSGILEPLVVKPSGVKARNMDRLPMSGEQVAGLNRIAMGIFIDMANSGASLHACVAAVYLSGLNHGAEITKEATDA